MTVSVDNKGRRIGFDGPDPLPVDTAPKGKRAPYRHLSTESSELLAALGHPIRIAVLLHVKRGEEISATELQHIEPLYALGAECTLVAHHVKRLAQAELLRPTRTVTGTNGRGRKQMYVLTERGKVMARICAVAEKMLAADADVGAP